MGFKLRRDIDFNENYELHVNNAVDFLKRKIPDSHRKNAWGVVLGSGLGDLAEQINGDKIPYSDIPNFPVPKADGHAGILHVGEIEGTPVIALQGRTHYYDVADEFANNGILKTVFSVHVLANLGVQNYFVTNAAGGLNTNYNVGDIMAINAHINMIPNPLLGRPKSFLRVDNNEPVWRFQPMNEAYDPALTELLMNAGREFPGRVHQGVYLALTGPTYETDAESRAYRDGLGADAVGMSTAPEVIVARNRGMKVVGFSCITNCIDEDGRNATNHEEVKRILEHIETRERLSTIVKGFFKRVK